MTVRWFVILAFTFAALSFLIPFGAVGGGFGSSFGLVFLSIPLALAWAATTYLGIKRSGYRAWPAVLGAPAALCWPFFLAAFIFDPVFGWM
jgi:hypothetical protein